MEIKDMEKNDMTLAQCIEMAFVNLNKKIYRAKFKDIGYSFDSNILNTVYVGCESGDISSVEFQEFLKQWQHDRLNHIGTSDIEAEYECDSEQHDYCHRSTWVSSASYDYLYHTIKEEITDDMILRESLNIGIIFQDDKLLKLIQELIIIKKKYSI